MAVKFGRRVKSHFRSCLFIIEHAFVNFPSALSAAWSSLVIYIIPQTQHLSDGSLKGAPYPECIALLVAICVMFGATKKMWRGSERAAENRKNLVNFETLKCFDECQRRGMNQLYKRVERGRVPFWTRVSGVLT